MLNFFKTFIHKKNLKNLFVVYRRKSDFTLSCSETIDIPSATVPEFVFQCFNKFPNKTAIVCDFTNRKYTFEDVQLKSENLNTNLRKNLNLQKGDVIAILLPNVADYPVCVFGSMQAGLTTTVMNPCFKPEEISRLVTYANAKAIITLSSLYGVVQNALNIAKRSIPILTVKPNLLDCTPTGAINLDEFIHTKSDVTGKVDLRPEDVALILYSSGTTGLPKGVELTHKNIVSNVCQITNEHMQFFPNNTEHRVLAVLPWFHVYGIVAVLFSQLCLLKKLICVPKFIPDDFTNMLKYYKPNELHVVPSLFSFLATNPSVKREHLESITTMTYGAAPTKRSDIEAFLKKVNKEINLIQGYGLTEVQAACFTSIRRNCKTNGIPAMEPLANTYIRIASPENYKKSLGANQLGEILIKGPQVMKGYLNNPDATNNAFFEGWYKTGDMGCYDKNGLVYVSERLKDIIKVNSFQVSPTELEEVIHEYKGVADVAVVGIPDKQYGEVPLAFVVSKSDIKLDVVDLQKYVTSKVVKYKQLKGGVVIVNNLPKNTAGKILRKRLLETYRNGSF